MATQNMFATPTGDPTIAALKKALETKEADRNKVDA